MAVFSSTKSFYNRQRIWILNWKKYAANQAIKLEPGSNGFNVRFYCNDGRFYYMPAQDHDLFIKYDYLNPVIFHLPTYPGKDHTPLQDISGMFLWLTAN